jgi:hypothetical protein
MGFAKPVTARATLSSAAMLELLALSNSSSIRCSDFG